jgi:hypothetical protein
MMSSLRRPSWAPGPRLSVGERFGIRSLNQVTGDLAEMLRDGVARRRFQFDLGSVGLLRPSLSLPAYAGFVPRDGRAPIFNLFDRVGGGRRYSQRVSRATCRDFRGGALTYDEHDGTDLVCPPGTPLAAAAPGVVVMIRDRWLRGGLTVAVDHGAGIVTQYTHCARALVRVGERIPRAATVALSGTSGVDMTQFFPWVAPHAHFMVYVNGRPVDPFLADGEAPRPGTWLGADDLPASGPAPASGPLPGDPDVADDTGAAGPSEVDADAIERVAAACTDPGIQGEIEARADDAPALAALIEDALCHDAWAFAAEVRGARVRPAGEPAPDAVRLTLPLPASDYCGVRLADTRRSAPGEADRAS